MTALKYDHVVLISLDTLRADCVNANPRPRLWQDKYTVTSPPRTRILDEIARRGTFFANCVSAAPYTSASHASFLTGQVPLRHGVFEFFHRALESETLFSFFRQAGYRTLLKTDFPIILGSYLGFDRDVDEYIKEDDTKFLDRLRDLKSATTFSLVHFGGMHIPYGFHNLRYGGDPYREVVSELESEIPESHNPPADRMVESERDEEDLELLLRYKRIIQYLYYVERDYDRIFQLYLDGITFFLERRFEQFFNRLENLLRGTRFLCVIFGDHGEEYDEESYGHHNSLAEGVLKVPLIFYGHDVEPCIYERRVRSTDVAPTLLEWTGFPRADGRYMDGTSLLEVFAGQRLPEKTAVAQTYTTELEKLMRFQVEVRRTGRSAERLQNILYKETIYKGEHKLTCSYYHFIMDNGRLELRPRETIKVLEKRTPEGRWTNVSELETAKSLETKMSLYNSMAKRGKELPDVPEEVLRGLRDMGYNL